jgi:hypothetical protein
MAQNDQSTIIEEQGTAISGKKPVPGYTMSEPGGYDKIDLEAEAKGFVEGVPRDERFASRLDDINDQIQAAKRGYENPIAPLVKNQLVLEFCMAGRESNPVVFHAFMQAFNESFQSKFKRDEVYGRTDPIPSYQATSRAITISFKLVGDNAMTAAKNMNSINKMVSFLYPTYDATIINKAPILGLRYINMGQEDSGWLYGTMGGFSINPDMEFGVYQIGELFEARNMDLLSLPAVNAAPSLNSQLESGIGKSVGILPKVITISCDFHPIHKKTLQAGMPNIVYGDIGVSDTTGRSPQGYFNKFTGKEQVDNLDPLLTLSGKKNLSGPLYDRYAAAKGQILDQYETSTAPGPVSGFFNKLFGPDYVERDGIMAPNDGTGRFKGWEGGTPGDFFEE